MLSARGSKWAQLTFAHGEHNDFDPVNNPNGVVSFANAENWLMHEELTQYINTHNHFEKSFCSYGEGSTGSLHLRTAMAHHLNQHFKPIQPISPEEITFAAGVTALNETCALLSCDADENEAIMLGKPVYGSFHRDLTTRTSISLEYFDVGDTDQFSPSCVAAYEKGLEDAKKRGVGVKALMICNPHNPLGRCYPRETLIGLLRLCAAKGIHLISDEIYALSVYDRDDREIEVFTSVRAIDFTNVIDPAQVHVLYGMSKDFGAAGMRLGCLISQNKEFTKATRAVCRFASPSLFSMDLAAKILLDQEFIGHFLRMSRKRLLQSRLFAEELLQKNGIQYHAKGNAGFFIWLDLSRHLPLTETNGGGDGWAAEKILSDRLAQAGVVMATGAAYRAPKPGRFRVVFCVPEAVLREGVERIARTLKIR